MGYNARNDEIRDNVTRMCRQWGERRDALATVRRFNARLSAKGYSWFWLPSIGSKEYAEAGGLIGYGVNILSLYRRAAYFIDRILKGSKPADLPIEQPTRFDFVITLKTGATASAC